MEQNFYQRLPQSPFHNALARATPDVVLYPRLFWGPDHEVINLKMVFYRRGSLLVRESQALEALQTRVIEQNLRWQRLLIRVALDLGLTPKEAEEILLKMQLTPELLPYYDEFQDFLAHREESARAQRLSETEFIRSRAVLVLDSGQEVPLLRSPYKDWSVEHTEQLTVLELQQIESFIQKEVTQWRDEDAESLDPKES